MGIVPPAHLAGKEELKLIIKAFYLYLMLPREIIKKYEQNTLIFFFFLKVLTVISDNIDPYFGVQGPLGHRAALRCPQSLDSRSSVSHRACRVPAVTS